MVLKPALLLKQIKALLDFSQILLRSNQATQSSGLPHTRTHTHVPYIHMLVIVIDRMTHP